MAAYYEDLEVVRILVALEASVNDRNSKGVTRSRFVVERGHLEVLEYFLAPEADVNAETVMNQVMCVLPLTEDTWMTSKRL